MLNAQEAALEPVVRIFGPGPQWRRISSLNTLQCCRCTTASIVLQENNAVATLDLTSNEIGVHALGFKDYSTLLFDLTTKTVTPTTVSIFKIGQT